MPWNPPLYDSQRRCAVKKTVAWYPARAESQVNV
nr:MAG TPA: hypothetical protein [Caudoviricetes sp.]